MARPTNAMSAMPGGSSASLDQVRTDLAELIRVVDIHLSRVEQLLTTSAYAANIFFLDFDLQNNPRYADPRRLLRHGAQVCSQSGEDGVIGEIFRRIGIQDRIFAEVGIGNGKESNTSFLLSQGWTGFWFDGDNACTKSFANRPDLAGRVKTLVSFISRESIAQLFSQLGVPNTIDLLSIDIDHNTYYAWEGLHEYRPRVVVVEYNATIPPDVNWKVRYDPKRTWDGTNNFGASLFALELLGRRFGYSLVGCDIAGVNAFFVRDDLTGDHFAAPFTAINHYEPPRYQLLMRRGHPNAILDRSTD